MVVERCQESEAQAEALAPVSVALGENTKDLETSDDVLGHEALLCQLPILSFLLARERMVLALLVRCAAIWVQFGDAQVAAVRQARDLCWHRHSALGEDLKVVRAARAEGDRQDLSSFLIGD